MSTSQFDEEEGATYDDGFDECHDDPAPYDDAGELTVGDLLKAAARFVRFIQRMSEEAEEEASYSWWREAAEKDPPHLFQFCDWCRCHRPASIRFELVDTRTSVGHLAAFVCEACLHESYEEADKAQKAYEKALRARKAPKVKRPRKRSGDAT